MTLFKFKSNWLTRIFTLSSLSFFALGLFGYALPAVGYFSAVPGDFGDDRFNSVILEHLFRWVSGHEVSLWSPTFFYPFEHVLAFSDNHFGSAVFYIILRFLGLSREIAFDGWFLIGIILSYFCTCWAFRRIGFSQLASAVGAFIFCFSLPVLDTEIHAQMCYRFATPLAFAAFWNLFTTKRLFLLWQVVFWVTIQFFCSIYLGVFLFYLLSATFIAWLIAEGKKQYFSDGLLGFQKEKRSATIFFCFATFTSISMLVWLLHKFYTATLQHPLEPIQYDSIYIGFFLLYVLSVTFIIWLIVAEKQYFIDLLLRFQKEKRAVTVFFYFATFTSVSVLVCFLHKYYTTMLEYAVKPNLFFLAKFSDYFLPESAVFLGFGVWILCLFGAVKSFQKGFEKKIGVIAVISFILLFVLTSWIECYSLYFFIYPIPGISAIRTVHRIVLVMLLPIGILAAISVEALQKKAVDASIGAKTLLLIALFTLLGAEVAAYHPRNTSINKWQARKNALLEKLPLQLPSDPILFVTIKEGELFYMAELDGMILAQDLGIPTLNGYSGNAPPGYSFAHPCSSYLNRLHNYASYRKLPPSAVKRLAQRVVTIVPTPCMSNQ